MSACTDSHGAKLVGCGATFVGRQQHSVARVPWSTHPDGRAHVTFANERACDMCWRGGCMHDPATLTHPKTGAPLLEVDAKGVWHDAKKRPENLHVTRETDANGRDGST